MKRVLVVALVLVGCGSSHSNDAQRQKAKQSAYQACFYAGIVGANTKDGHLTKKQQERLNNHHGDDCEHLKP